MSIFQVFRSIKAEAVEHTRSPISQKARRDDIVQFIYWSLVNAMLSWRFVILVIVVSALGGFWEHFR